MITNIANYINTDKPIQLGVNIDPVPTSQKTNPHNRIINDIIALFLLIYIYSIYFTLSDINQNHEIISHAK